MIKNFRNISKKIARDSRNEILDDRVANPLARKAGGCATVFFILLFAGLGVFLVVTLTKGGADGDKIGPIMIGVAIFAGIILGAIVGNLVGKLLRKLLIK